MGFIRSKVDLYLFFNFQHSIPIYLLIYIDDIIITGGEEEVISSLIKHPNASFLLKHLGLHNYFLNVEVTSFYVDDLLLNHTKYIKELLHQRQYGFI